MEGEWDGRGSGGGKMGLREMEWRESGAEREWGEGKSGRVCNKISCLSPLFTAEELYTVFTPLTAATVITKGFQCSHCYIGFPRDFRILIIIPDT